jgi:hypothetical protein
MFAHDVTEQRSVGCLRILNKWFAQTSKLGAYLHATAIFGHSANPQLDIAQIVIKNKINFKIKEK